MFPRRCMTTLSVSPRGDPWGGNSEGDPHKGIPRGDSLRGFPGGIPLDPTRSLQDFLRRPNAKSLTQNPLSHSKIVPNHHHIPICQPCVAKLCWFGSACNSRGSPYLHVSVCLVERRCAYLVIRTTLPMLLAQSRLSSVLRGRILYQHGPHKIAHNVCCLLWGRESTNKQICGGVRMAF